MATGGVDESILSVTKLAIEKANEILWGLVNDDSLTLSKMDKIIVNRQSIKYCMTGTMSYWLQLHQ